MDHDKEIEKHRNEISKIEQARRKERLKSFPDIAGKYFRLSTEAVCKLVKVTDHNTSIASENVICSGVFVGFKLDGSTAAIDALAVGMFLEIKDEITQKEFNATYIKALKIISKAL